MYTLKSIARRGSLLGAAVAVFAAVVVPATPAFADALNPLTDRSLTLSSSSPGWDYRDGSGNATYAPPNSGANGQKTGNTFTFKVSTDSTISGKGIKGFSFQYCTTSAGNCTAPGDGTTPGHSNLEVVTSSPSEVSSTTWNIIRPGGTGRAQITGQLDPADNVYNGVPKMDGSEGNFVVLVNGVHSSGWTMATDNQEPGSSSPTGADNYISLVNTTAATPTPGTEVKIIFFANETNYITNPGSGAFFVKINSYSSDATLDDTTLLDGGVTVANVMNQSIQITTKVLETMQFSVGTVDPNTLDSDGGNASELFAANGNTAHGPCDPIVRGMEANDPLKATNTLQMGNPDGEFSLETDKTYSTHSYWRLSSNSSAGATVYYSGVTLSNTVGDQIDAIGKTAAAPLKGKEQFGLAIANGTGADVADTNSDGINDTGYAVNYTVERGQPQPKGNLENGADNSTSGVHASTIAELVTVPNASYHAPRLYPLVPKANYIDGAGVVNADYAAGSTPVDTSFAFDTDSNTVPVPIADQSSQVVDCVTAKMRYIANIAATTPAGIYTTKINYIAAPQY